MISLVLGSAFSLHGDIEAALALVGDRPYQVVACNQSVFEWPHRLDHFATMHPEQMAPWLWKREARGYPMGFTTWTRPYPFGMKDRERLCDRTLGENWHGSSGLLALGVAHETGGTRNLLCGIRLDTTPHFNSGAWSGAPNYRERWLELADTLRSTTRSFGGWTAELLGEPTTEWITTTAGGHDGTAVHD